MKKYRKNEENIDMINIKKAKKNYLIKYIEIDGNISLIYY